MDRQKGLSLFDILVVLFTVMFALYTYLIILGPLQRPHEYGKRAQCLGNLKQLQLAWSLYANDNNEKIVCGEVYSGVKGTNGVRTVSGGVEPYWTGDDVTDASLMTKLSEEKQISAIKSGALYPYIKTVKSYRCPLGEKGEMRTYTIVDSMNGTFRSLEDKKFDNIPLYIKTTTDINSPAQRIVFVDVGKATPGSFAVYYDKEQWWNPATIRHTNVISGTSLSFADGHAEYWRWKGTETIANGKLAKPKQDLQPTTEAGLEDLHKFQKGVWGRLGY
jgi:hypothetical protein